MAHTYFIADLHLADDRPDITQCFLDFLANDAIHAEKLYILGDLFEVWIGDDDVTPFNTTITNAIKAASHHLPIYFIHGNRDFAIRETWAKRAGVTLLNEQTVIDLYGQPTLITHGDELCTDDIAYQKFRKKSRGWWWPRLMLATPLWFRRKMASRGRKVSASNKANLTMQIMDVNQAAVETAMLQHNVRQLIHGHTHRPNIHWLKLNGECGKRVVVGDWYEQGSVLEVSANGIELQRRQFTKSDSSRQP